MEMSVQEFLNSVSNPRTRKGYRFGLNKFVGRLQHQLSKKHDLRNTSALQVLSDACHYAFRQQSLADGSNHQELSVDD